MARRVRFYRGEQGTSLPVNHQDGAIFIIERDSAKSLGDMYVDMDNGKRLHIIPDSGFQVYNSTMNSQPSALGQVYVVMETDPNKQQTQEQAELNPTQLYQIGVKIGDGKAYIGDLPTYIAITTEEKKIWNSKVDAFMANEISAFSYEHASTNDSEELVLTRVLYMDNNVIKHI